MPPSKVEELIFIIQTHDDKYKPIQINIPRGLGNKREREKLLAKVEEAVLAKHSAKKVVYSGPIDEMPYYKANFEVQLVNA